MSKLVLFAGLALLIYWPGIAAPLYLDDPMVIVNSIELHSGSTRPLGYATFWASTKLAQLPGGVLWYRIPNVIIHGTAAWVLWLLIAELSDRRRAWIAAMFFLLHPIQTQGVVYISQRFESLATLGMLLSGLGYMRTIHRYQNRWLVLMIAAAAAAGMSKETAIVLPFWLLLLRPVRLARRTLTLAAAAGVVLFIPLWRGFRSAGNALTSTRWDQYVIGQGDVIIRYLEIVFFPEQQYLLYGPLPHHVWAWPLLLTIIAVGVWLYRSSHQLAGLGILSAFLFLVPTSLLPLPDPIFEHRMYPAMIGVAMLFSALPWTRRTAALWTTAFLLLGARTAGRTTEWLNPVPFWESHRAAFPQDPTILSALAVAYGEQGINDKARDTNRAAAANLHLANSYYRERLGPVIAVNQAILDRRIWTGPIPSYISTFTSP